VCLSIRQPPLVYVLLNRTCICLNPIPLLSSMKGAIVYLGAARNMEQSNGHVVLAQKVFSVMKGV
jgi:hypothetical protein